MRNNLAAFLVTAVIILIIPAPPLHSATMNDYCNAPPSVSSAVPPNIFLATDVSGSMTWPAYFDNTSGLPAYNSSTTYEGYFTPTINYIIKNGVSVETNNAEACTGPTLMYWVDWFGNYWYYYTLSGTCSGNKLNYALMSRIDLVRWAVTGGAPSTCGPTSNANYCDPELYNQPGNNSKVGSVCNDTLAIDDGTLNIKGGCTLLDSSGDMVNAPWSRVNSGLTTTFKGFSVVPRMGGFFFSGSGVLPQGQVYMGDFTGSNNRSAQFPYSNLITAINSIAPINGTPTGPAMWDVLNYFQQTPPQYGGFAVQQGNGDMWKNPMYVCPDKGGQNCVLTSCAKNFVILLSDGQWNYPSCSITDGVSDPVQPAYKMHMGFTNVPANVSTNVNAVYTIGLFLGGTGAQAMQNIAMYGSFNTTGKTWPDSLTGYPQGTCYMTDCGGSGQGSGCTSLPLSSPDWDADGDSVPDTYYNASNALAIKNAITNAVLDALRRASSGTATSILASSGGSGAAMMQSLFYPTRQFDNNTQVAWTSELDALWYYLDPALQNNSTREDTVPDKKLVINQDYVIQFRFDTTQNKTVADRLSDDGTGHYTPVDTVDIDSVSALWKAGTILFKRDVTSDPRTIYTTTDLKTLTSFTGLDPYSSANQALLQEVGNSTEASNLINYVKGVDHTGYRSRTVTTGGVTGVWKLGDILSSSPKIEASSELDHYDQQPSGGYGDTTYGQFTSSLNYLTRNMVFAAANDGMLHAFKLGTLDESTASGYQKATLCDDTNGDGKCENNETSTVNLGREQWAYIPYNALPYLKYLTDPNYCHLFYVDGPLYLFDASINQTSDCPSGSYSDCTRETTYQTGTTNLNTGLTSWKTVLIGSMGQGGACRNYGLACNGGSANCVNTPISGAGYSSYYALDVTDPANPSFMWEFSDSSSPSSLGYSLAGPAVVRLSAHKSDGTPDITKNGKWFAVFASGPTGPISSNQFQGKSDQNLRLFVVDLKTGALLKTLVMDGTNGMPNLPNAYATASINSPIDTDRWNSNSPGFYQDNVFYIGYVKQCPSSNTTCTDTTWTNGGVLRVITNENLDPGSWTVSKLIDDIGPVTSSVAKLQDRNKGHLWLYFGTGRYFFRSSTSIDDQNSQRSIYGIMDPCYNPTTNTITVNCTQPPVQASSLTDRTTDNSTAAEAPAGWFINLAPAASPLSAERVITDPLSTPAGIVYFTTFEPSSDICSSGGTTHIWAVGYNTGTSDIAINSTVTTPISSLMKGSALLQVSTGAIVQVGLASTFASGRESAAITGQPPKGQGLSVVISPKPLKKILHIKEK